MQKPPSDLNEFQCLMWIAANKGKVMLENDQAYHNKTHNSIHNLLLDKKIDIIRSHKTNGGYVFQMEILESKENANNTQ